MRISITLLFLATLQIFAENSYSQTVKLSLNLQQVSVEDVLDEIEQQSEFYFVFNYKLIDVERQVDIQVEKESIGGILTKVFSGFGVSYVILDRQILLSPEELLNGIAGVAQPRTVSGKVTDESGQPLLGVTVLVRGTTNGTITSVDGTYSLSNIPEDAVVVFSYVGMQTLEIRVGEQTTIDVTMQFDAIGIYEVVAIGYGTQRKVNMTGSVASISFDEILENRPITNASQALSGKVPGLWVSQNSGKPGNDDALIRIRGWGTLNNANPLIIIDDIEGSFSQINPNDIESISVLKDAASAAIYGAKAANGVILITTKRAKFQEKMQVALNSYFGIQTLGRSYDLIDNSVEYMELWNQAMTNEGKSPYFPDYLISAFENGDDPYKYPNTNWNDELFQNAIIHEHNLSIKGGTAKTSSFISLNYLNQDGLVPNTGSERYGIRTNIDSEINSWLTVTGRLNYLKKVSKENYLGTNRVFEMFGGAPPYIAPYTRDGRFGSVEAINNEGTLLTDNRNPLIDAANGAWTTDSDFLAINVSTTIDFSDYLHWKTTLSSSGNWSLSDRYNESLYGYTDSGIETTTKNYNREGIEIIRDQVSTLDNNVYSTLTFNKELYEIHDFSAIVGIQLEDWKSKNIYARRSDPPKEGLTQVDAGTSGIQNAGNMTGFRMFSYFGRINYSLADKYLFEANFRADASSRFKKENQWGMFPGFSAGWRLSEESFIEELGVFSNLKLRASWGQLGNQSIVGYWPYLTVIDQNNTLSYNYNNSFAPGSSVTSFVDENITWETTSTLDFGIDVGFLRNKINIEADYFKKKTTDIIVQLPIPYIMGGLAAPFENVGEMFNNGFEFNFNYNNQALTRHQFGYFLNFNVTYVDNEVTKFRGGDSPDQLYLIREGYSYNTLYGYKAIGIYQSDEEAAEHMYANGYVPKAGNLKFEDVNNDGRLGYEDKMDLGNTIPKFTYGITSNFQYKGFDLNILFQGIADVSAFTYSMMSQATVQHATFTKKWQDAWTPQNTNTNIPSFKLDNSWDNSESSFWVQDISFFKMKNLQLGYSFPEDISSRVGLQKIYLYVNAQNVFTIVNKDYEGYDPERDTFRSDHQKYPVPRIFVFGINLNF